LEQLGCTHIKTERNEWITCALPSGKNKRAVQVNTNTLICKVFTRDVSGDIISLVEFIKELSFPQAMKWICDTCGYDYYNINNEDDSTNELDLLKWLDNIEGNEVEIDHKVKPIPETVLNDYELCPNIWFIKDGIKPNIQKLFNIGFDRRTERITIPIYDELGILTGIKGRTINKKDEDDKKKYIYLHPTSKSKLLFGLDKTYKNIKERKEVFIVEAEKGVMQLMSHGINNVVALGSMDVSDVQLEKIIRLNATPIFALDKGVTKKHLINIINRFKFFGKVGVMYDDVKSDLLKDKESPADNIEAFKLLYDKVRYFV